MSGVSLFSQSDNTISQSITVDETKRGLLFIVILTSQDPETVTGPTVLDKSFEGCLWLKNPV